jgi:hypothetical protein
MKINVFLLLKNIPHTLFFSKVLQTQTIVGQFLPLIVFFTIANYFFLFKIDILASVIEAKIFFQGENIEINIL